MTAADFRKDFRHRPGEAISDFIEEILRALEKKEQEHTQAMFFQTQQSGLDLVIESTRGLQRLREKAHAVVVEWSRSEKRKSRWTDLDGCIYDLREDMEFQFKMRFEP